MTLNNIMSKVNDIRANSYDNRTKIDFINEVESDIAKNIINRSMIGKEYVFKPYEDGVDDDKELLVPDNHSDVYLFYIFAKMSYFDEETARYNNDMIMFNNAYERFASEYRRNNIPINQNISI